MKKTKKHSFTHKDPEKTIVAKSVDAKAASKGKLSVPNRVDNVAPFVYRDLKRTAIIIGTFVICLVILYLVQTKTGLMRPVLRLFNL